MDTTENQKGERAVNTHGTEDLGFSQPKPVTAIDMAFGGRIAELMPPYNALPEEFRRERDPFTRLVHKWFFEGISKDSVKAKPGIDSEAAWCHLKAIMRSFEPSHEHKTAGVAWLMSQWFEPSQVKS